MFSAAHFHLSLLLYVCVTPFEFVCCHLVASGVGLICAFVVTSSSIINLQICLWLCFISLKFLCLCFFEVLQFFFLALFVFI